VNIIETIYNDIQRRSMLPFFEKISNTLIHEKLSREIKDESNYSITAGKVLNQKPQTSQTH